MRVLRLDLAYDGTDFRGWARQRGQRTVEGVLLDALERVVRERPRLSVAGRTDAGVHAQGQVVSFQVAAGIEPERVARSVNAMLAPEVVAWRGRWAPDGFDARFSARGREYVYRVNLAPVPDPFEARFVWHRAGDVSVGAMRRAARDLVGEHDFTSFCRAPQGNASTVRHLQRLAVSRRGDRVEIRARANGFLHQMVRSLVGTLLAAGEGRLDPGSMGTILEAHDRSAAGPVAPAHGLTLERVIYGRPVRRHLEE
ncbi:MAG: tRNA pseudouridine(38-40) synthase TruA [Actinomycetota bacterium]